MTGLFIVFEGGDGVGKSTQVNLLTTWCRERGIRHLETRQPGGTRVGDALRRLVLDPATGEVASRAEALIYAADKAQHVEEVLRPALRSGTMVVCDRYVDSMIAYQGAGRDLDVEEMAQVAWWATGDLQPDLTIVLDADPAEAVERIETKDRLEGAGLAFHRRARQHFLHLAEAQPERYLVLDAGRSRDEIARTIRARVEDLLASHA